MGTLDESGSHGTEFVPADIEVNIIRCGSCGEAIISDPLNTPVSCPFCGKQVDKKNAILDRVTRPDFIFPFSIGRNKACSMALQWLRSRSFAPAGLAELTGNDIDISGLYLPFWMFGGDPDYSIDGSSLFDVLDICNIFVTDSKGFLSSGLSDILTGTDEKISRRLLKITEPDKYGENDIPVNNLNGFITERYRFDMNNGLLKKENLIDMESSNLLRAEFHWKNTRREILKNLSLNENDIDINEFHINTYYKLVLMPVWYGSYLYGTEKYNFVLNGCTGKLYGQRPYSYIKGIVLLTIIVISLGVIFGYAFSGQA